MSSLRIVVFLGAVPGREAEFDRWCATDHLPALLSIPGVTGARRFRSQRFVASPPASSGVLLQVGEAGAPGVADALRAVPLSDAADASTLVAWSLTPSGPLTFSGGRPWTPDPDLHRFVTLAFLNARPGRDAEFIEYYDTVHMVNSLSIPQCRDGQRFLAAPLIGPEPPGVYATPYTWEGETLQEVLGSTGHLDADGKPHEGEILHRFPPPHGTHPSGDFSSGQADPLITVGPA